MPSQLTLYNGALEILGERTLASLTENREPRHKLDDIWSRDAVDRCLQQGQWNFAIRSAQPAVSTSITPTFGYRNAFEKPDDYIRLAGMCEDEYFKFPMREYTDEASFWFADLDIIFVRYVSNDSQYGNDLGNWPPNFSEFVEHWLAYKVAPRLAGLDFDDAQLGKRLKAARAAAKNTDAMEQPAKQQPPNLWVRARWGHSGGDRGNRSSLIG